MIADNATPREHLANQAGTVASHVLVDEEARRQDDTPDCFGRGTLTAQWTAALPARSGLLLPSNTRALEVLAHTIFIFLVTGQIQKRVSSAFLTGEIE